MKESLRVFRSLCLIASPIQWIGILLAFTLVGCHGPSPMRPPTWTGTEVSPMTLVDREQARLHVFIIYTSTMCSHTVLRIHSPTHGTVFWDPAGGYGEPDYPVKAKRYRDLVVDPIPTVLDYLDFRQYLPTAEMEIFEFELEDSEARRMIDVLHSVMSDAPDRFDTRTSPFYCGKRISEFLADHARGVVEVTPKFYPHDLAAQLYAQPPDRVLVYREELVFHYRPE